MNTLINFISVFLPILFVGLTLSATFYFFPDFKHYRRVYKTLKNRHFVKFNNVVFAFNKGEEKNVDSNNVVMWSIDLDGFVLTDKVFLINSLITCFCPYSFYWLIRYQLFFKRIIKSDKLKTVSEMPKK